MDRVRKKHVKGNFQMTLSSDKKKILSWDDANGYVCVPDEIEEIGNGAFFQASLLKGIILPSSLKKIGNSAFDGCTSLKKITLPSSVEHIGEGAFRNCSSLAGIEIPSKIKRLYQNTFANCEKLMWAKLNSRLEYISPYEYVFYDIPKEFQLVVPMELLDYYKKSPFKVYTITPEWKLPNRTWDDCVEEWNAYVSCLRQSKNMLAQMILKMIESGLDTASFFPIGICLTVDEYNIFKSEGRNLKEILGWCESGNDIHERLRLTHNMSRFDDNCIGLSTPRKGFYEIVEVCSDNTVKCHFNYRRFTVFNDDIVTIRRQPFYNYVSVGPKTSDLYVGDIIEVKEDVSLVDCFYNENSYKAYRLVWDFIKKSPRHQSNYYGRDYKNYDKPSYSQYGGYNDYDDDTIDSAFEGDPEATWNVD